MKISIIIPVYNELQTIEKIVAKILSLKNLKKQIVIVDDFSTDGTRKVIRTKIEKKVNKVIYHKKNLGKGAAIISAIKFIRGDLVIIQDADLEYSPNDYKKLIKPIITRKFKIVYGSRVLGKSRYKSKKFTSLFRIFCNHILTIFSNILNSQNLTDAHTCYKVSDADIFRKMNLKEKDFSFCPEFTTKASKMGLKIKEVPITYKGRSFEEGKKIGLNDGIKAIKTLIKYKFFDNDPLQN